MIKTFKHKGLKKLFETGNHKGVNPDHVKRLRLILARLDVSHNSDDMNLPCLNLHPYTWRFKVILGCYCIK